MNCIRDFTGSPVALDAGNLLSLPALPPDDFRIIGLPWNNQGRFIPNLFRFTNSNRLTFYRNGPQQLIERRTAETLKAGQFVPREKSICSILISCGSKRPRILHVQPSPQLGLQSEGTVSLFLTQAVNSSETAPALLLVFSKLHLTGRDIKLSSRDSSPCVSMW